jgi:CheY-like chemotaxis protein
MRILLIEDDENKRNQILAFLKATYTLLELDLAGSYQSGLKRLLVGAYDIVLLDMTIPTFDVTGVDDGGRPQAYGGRELLRQMSRRGILTPVLVITQFDRFGEHRNAVTLEQLDAMLRREHSNLYRGSVHYDSSLEGWKEELASHLVDFGPENNEDIDSRG